MSKTIEIVKIIVSICVIVIIGIGLIIYLSGDKDSELYSTVYDKKISNNINSVFVNWNSDGVKIMKSDDNNTRIVEKSSKSNKHKLSFNINNNKLTISKGDNSFFSFGKIFSGSNILEIYLPEKEYDDISLNYTSGKYEVFDVKAKNFEVSATSGATTLEGIDAKNLKIESTSGRVSFNGSAETISLNLTSGSCEIKTSTMLKGLDARLTSGNAEILMPENNGFITNLKSTSGKFVSDFKYITNGDKYLYKDGGPEFHVNITSGKVHLKRN